MWGLAIRRSFALFVVLTITMIPFLAQISASEDGEQDILVAIAKVSREFLFSAVAFGTAAGFDGSDSFESSDWRSYALGVVEVLWFLTVVGVVISAMMLFLTQSSGVVATADWGVVLTRYVMGLFVLINGTALAFAVTVRKHWAERSQ